MQKVVALKSIHAPEALNSRTVYDGIDELAERIKSEGLITPLTVAPNGTGDTYILVAGFRRFKALKQLRVKEVEVQVRDKLTPKEYAFLNFGENLWREDLHPADQAKWCAEMASGVRLHEKGSEEVGEAVSREEIAKRLGLSKTHVGNLIRAHEQLIPKAKQAWRKFDDATRFMFSLCTYTADEQEEELAKWLLKKQGEKETGKKRRSGGGDGEMPSGQKATAKEVRDMLEVLQGMEEDAGLKGQDLAYLKGKICALRFAQGDIGARYAQSASYK